MKSNLIFHNLICNIASPKEQKPSKKIRTKKAEAKVAEDNALSIFDIIDPFADLVTKFLWNYVKNDDKEEVVNDNEASQIAETYENIKYFEQQRIRQSGNESVNGERLSFKGKLGSAKCDESVVNCQVDAPSCKNKEVDPNG